MIEQVSRHRLVACQAVVLQDFAVFLFDRDGFMEILEGETLRVVVAILSLGQITFDKWLR